MKNRIYSYGHNLRVVAGQAKESNTTEKKRHPSFGISYLLPPTAEQGGSMDQTPPKAH